MVTINPQALVRDDFCCLVTGSVDIKLVNAHETLRDKARVVDGKPLLCYMAGIPIFPKAMCRGRFWWQGESASEVGSFLGLKSRRADKATEQSLV